MTHESAYQVAEQYEKAAGEWRLAAIIAEGLSANETSNIDTRDRARLSFAEANARATELVAVSMLWFAKAREIQ